jgi:hypothetical protein
MIAWLGLLAIALTHKSSELELVSFHRLETTERFDLSGIIRVDDIIRKNFNAQGDFLMINDKTPMIYDAKIKGDSVHLIPLLNLKDLGAKGDFDLEGIDASRGEIYVLNEAQDSVIILSGNRPQDLKVLQSDPPLSRLFPAYQLSKKFGLEGLAVKDKSVLLAKEMLPLAIFEISETSKPKLFERNQLGSQTDIKIHRDDLFILDREGRCIWKTKLPFRSQETCYSFEKALAHPELDYWARDAKGVPQPQWGTAEALEVSDDRFVIGLDNNGQSLKSRSDSRPVIVILKR